MVNLREFQTAKKRRQALEKEWGISLDNIGQFSFSEDEVRNKNIENLIGASQIPLGIAGPVKVNGQYAKGEFYLPLATSEGALVASVNRGCKAITLAEGAMVMVEKVGITRGPVFKTNSLNQSFKLAQWLSSHFNDIHHCTRQTSSHIGLLKIETQVLGRLVYARFYFDTSEAMGMNMATVATNSIIQIIEKETGAVCVSITGNFCVDKKPSWRNFILGRGRKVWAEAVISRNIVRTVLKTTPEEIFKVWLSKCMLGSAISGSLGFNAHFGNIVAAIFCATGQDLAHIVEGSLGITTVELGVAVKAGMANNLYISIYLPDLIIGTIGGGTNLATQKEGLAIIFGQEKPQVDIFAEVIAGAVLAGELSLLASLAEGSLTQAHQRLGRGKSI
jgi:hydroxymethylglutaryl-CoA reductase (NADPH)